MWPATARALVAWHALPSLVAVLTPYAPTVAVRVHPGGVLTRGWEQVAALREMLWLLFERRDQVLSMGVRTPSGSFPPLNYPALQSPTLDRSG